MRDPRISEEADTAQAATDYADSSLGSVLNCLSREVCGWLSDQFGHVSIPLHDKAFKP
jgi:nitrate/nitrite transporter NarK